MDNLSYCVYCGQDNQTGHSKACPKFVGVELDFDSIQSLRKGDAFKAIFKREGTEITIPLFAGLLKTNLEIRNFNHSLNFYFYYKNIWSSIEKLHSQILVTPNFVTPGVSPNDIQIILDFARFGLLCSYKQVEANGKKKIQMGIENEFVTRKLIYENAKFKIRLIKEIKKSEPPLPFSTTIIKKILGDSKEKTIIEFEKILAESLS